MVVRVSGWPSALALLLASSVAAPAVADEPLPPVDLFPTLSGTVTAPRRPPPAVQPPAPRPLPDYYGHQTLVVRGAAAAAIAIAIVAADETEGGSLALGVGGALALVFGPAVVHAAHGQPRNAALSVGLNLLATSVGVGAGVAVGSSAGGDSGAGAALGGLVGAGMAQLVMLVLDATWLGYADEPD